MILLVKPLKFLRVFLLELLKSLFFPEKSFKVFLLRSVALDWQTWQLRLNPFSVHHSGKLLEAGTKKEKGESARDITLSLHNLRVINLIGTLVAN